MLGILPYPLNMLFIVYSMYFWLVECFWLIELRARLYLGWRDDSWVKSAYCCCIEFNLSLQIFQGKHYSFLDNSHLGELSLGSSGCSQSEENYKLYILSIGGWIIISGCVL